MESSYDLTITLKLTQHEAEALLELVERPVVSLDSNVRLELQKHLSKRLDFHTL